MLLKKDYKIGNMHNYEAELKENINKLYYCVQEEYTYLINTKVDMNTGQKLSKEELKNRFNSYKNELKAIKKAKKEWILDENSYLVSPEVDEILENALIRNKLLDSEGYLLSYSKELKDNENKQLEDNKKNKKRKKVIATLAGTVGIALGVAGTMLGNHIHTVSEGKNIIYKEIDEEADDFRLYINGSSELHAFYEGETYENASLAIKEFARDMSYEGYNTAEIASYLREKCENGSLKYNEIKELLGVTKKDINDACKAKYYESKVKKLKIKKGE